MPIYDIDRIHLDDNIPSRTIRTGLSFIQAYDHCINPEAGSSTAMYRTQKEEQRRSGSIGWFDCYRETT